MHMFHEACINMSGFLYDSLSTIESTDPAESASNLFYFVILIKVVFIYLERTNLMKARFLINTTIFIVTVALISNYNHGN
jgi:hypothetical protein